MKYNSNLLVYWNLLSSDIYRTSSIKLLNKRFSYFSSYTPSFPSLSKPIYYNEYISNKEWNENILIINNFIYFWWLPYSYLTIISLILSFIFIFPIIFYFKYDEEGLYCYRNYQRKQLYYKLIPICEEITLTSPLIWSVSLSNNDDINDDSIVKELILTIKLKIPVEPYETEINEKKDTLLRSRIISFICSNQESRGAETATPSSSTPSAAAPSAAAVMENLEGASEEKV